MQLPSADPVYLFVYGTLRRGSEAPVLKLIKDAVEWIGFAQVKGKLYDIGDYPGATPLEDSASVIVGEVMLLKNAEEVFVVLDEYEAHDPENAGGSEFCRMIEEVMLKDGAVVKAWIYWYNFEVDGMKQIADGDYVHYLKKNKRSISYGALQHEPEFEGLEAEK